MRRVSVIVVCFNHGRFVEACLDSIRAQSFRDFEWIIIDDASTDGSADRIDAWLNETSVAATLVRNAHNEGVCRTLNKALGLASGQYLAFIAADDVWETDMLHAMAEALEVAGREYAMAFSDARIVDEHGAPVAESFIAEQGVARVPDEGEMFSALLRGNFIPAMATLLRASAVREAGGFDEALHYEDWDLWLRLAWRYKLRFRPGVTARYRIVRDSAFRTLTSTAAGQARLAESNFATFSKVLALPRLPESDRAEAARKLGVAARLAYRAGHPRARAMLRTAAARRPEPKTLVYGALASLGIAHRTVAPLEAVLGRARSRTR